MTVGTLLYTAVATSSGMRISPSGIGNGNPCSYGIWAMSVLWETLTCLFFIAMITEIIRRDIGSSKGIADLPVKQIGLKVHCLKFQLEKFYIVREVET